MVQQKKLLKFIWFVIFWYYFNFESKLSLNVIILNNIQFSQVKLYSWLFLYGNVMLTVLMLIKKY